MRSLVLLVALSGVAFATPPPKLAPGSKKPAKTKTQAEIAEQRNWDGTQLYAKKKYGEATQAFREAVARVPEGRYFYNLCASMFNEGKFSEALTACNAVSKTEPTKQIQKMADDLTVIIKDEAKAQGLELQR